MVFEMWSSYLFMVALVGLMCFPLQANRRYKSLLDMVTMVIIFVHQFLITIMGRGLTKVRSCSCSCKKKRERKRAFFKSL